MFAIVFCALLFPTEVRAVEPEAAKTSTSVADGRRTLSQFPKNVGRGFVGVFQKESLRPFLIGVAATGFSSVFDEDVRDEIADEDDETADFAADNLGPVGLGLVTLGLFIGGRNSGDQRFRDMSYDLGEAFLVNLGYTGALKAAVGRERPNESDNKSFPSGHTSNAFALASVAGAHYGTTVGIPAYGLASLIGLSRLRGNDHWLSDVIAGATLGRIVGLAVVRQNSKPQQTSIKGLSIMPTLSPKFRGILVGMNF